MSVSWAAYLDLLASTEKLAEAAEKLIDGASDERPDDWGLGRDVWASDFEALKIQVESTRTVLREAPTKPIERTENGSEPNARRAGAAEAVHTTAVGQNPG